MATTPKGIYYPNNYNEIADIPEDMKKMAESIEEVFENTDSDLSDIKEEQTTQNNRLNSLEVDNTTNKSDILTNKQEINNIKTEQTEQNTNISTNATNIETLQSENETLKSIVAQLPQVEGQGTEVTLENTIEAQFTKFDVEGNSTQDGTPSPDNEVPILSAGDNENLFDKDNEEQFLQNLTPDNNGLIVSTQTSTTSPNYIRTIIIPCKSDANYAITRFLGGKTFFIYESDEYPSLNKQTTLLKRNNDAGKASEIIKTSATAKYLLVKIYNTYASEYYSYDELISSIKIEKGNKASGYSPYGMGSINEKITNSDGIEEQDYSIFVQQPMRSIGDVRDCFVKKDGNWYERHYIKYLELLISAMNNSENYPGWTNVQQIKNDFPNINTQLITKTSFLCNIFEKTSRIMVINTVGNNSILYLDKSLLNLTQTQWKENYPDLILKLAYISPLPTDLPCTPEQIQQLENLPSTYKDFTIIQSQDETPAYLEVAGIYDLNKLITRTEVLESES